MATRIGEMPCLNPKCGCTDVAVEETPVGTWQAKCHKCGCPTFGKRGSKWRRDMEAMTTLDADPTPSPAPAPVTSTNPAPAPTPAPAKPAKARTSAFDLSSL